MVGPVDLAGARRKVKVNTLVWSMRREVWSETGPMTTGVKVLRGHSPGLTSGWSTHHAFSVQPSRGHSDESSGKC